MYYLFQETFSDPTSILLSPSKSAVVILPVYTQAHLITYTACKHLDYSSFCFFNNSLLYLCRTREVKYSRWEEGYDKGSGANLGRG